MSFQMVPEYNPLGAVLEAAARFLETYAVTRAERQQRESDEAYRQAGLDLQREGLELERQRAQAAERQFRQEFGLDVREQDLREKQASPEYIRSLGELQNELTMEGLLNQVEARLLELPADARRAEHDYRMEEIKAQNAGRGGGADGMGKFTPGQLGLLGFMDEGRQPMLSDTMTPDERAAEIARAESFGRMYLDALGDISLAAGDSLTYNMVEQMKQAKPVPEPQPVQLTDEERRKRIRAMEKAVDENYDRGFLGLRKSPSEAAKKEATKIPLPFGMGRDQSVYYEALRRRLAEQRGTAYTDSLLQAQ